MMILLTPCTLYVFWEREVGETEWSCSLVLFCTLPASSSPLCSGSWWRMICDSKPKSLFTKGPPPLRQQCVLEQRGKRFVSSRREARGGFWQVSDCRSLKRKCVCVCVNTCASVIQTRTRYTGEGWQLPDCGAGADAMLLPSDAIKRSC